MEFQGLGTRTTERSAPVKHRGEGTFASSFTDSPTSWSLPPPKCGEKSLRFKEKLISLVVIKPPGYQGQTDTKAQLKGVRIRGILRNRRKSAIEESNGRRWSHRMLPRLRRLMYSITLQREQAKSLSSVEFILFSAAPGFCPRRDARFRLRGCTLLSDPSAGVRPHSPSCRCRKRLLLRCLVRHFKGDQTFLTERVLFITLPTYVLEVMGKK